MKIFVTLIILFFAAEIKAQTVEDAKHFSGWVHMENDHEKSYKSAKNNKSFEEFLFSSAFLFYKQFFSSQDKNPCTFSPSCSEYALQSVKKEGVVLGVLSGFDRLSRCHNLHREKYDIQPHTHLLSDPVE